MDLGILRNLTVWYFKREHLRYAMNILISLKVRHWLRKFSESLCVLRPAGLLVWLPNHRYAYV